ncbi:MAG: hypothetical protein JRH20_22495, partial [Deltaproteobacteria bacterium]|nr:hypothetical protein [Deltaproteobacteria bacterium]
MSLCLLLISVGCAVEQSFDPIAALQQRSHLRAELDLLEDGADLRLDARRIVEALRFGGWQAAQALEFGETLSV